MRAIIVPLLRCPASGQRLRLYAERGGPSPRPNGIKLGAYCSSALVQLFAQSNLGKRLGDSSDGGLAERLIGFDVRTGALYTNDREYVYPIVNGIPRLLPPEQCRHPEETEYYRKRLESPNERPTERPKAILEDTLGSYTIQWEKLETAAASSVPVQQRFETMQDELGIADFPGVLAGKRHLDAACGDVAVALRIAELGAEVFALDPDAGSELDGAAHELSVPRLGIVHLIQGDLAAPPFAPGIFDSLYCGALHRTNDFEASLGRLAALVAPESARFYVWTRRRSLAARLLFALLRGLFALVPSSLRPSAARAAALPYVLGRWIARLIFGRDAFPRLTYKQSLLQLLDALSERWGSVPNARSFEAMVARASFASVELKRPGKRGYGVLGVRP